MCFIPNCLLLPPSVKRIYEQGFGLSGCLFVTELRPAALPLTGSVLGMKCHWPVFLARHRVLPCRCSSWRTCFSQACGCRKHGHRKAGLCSSAFLGTGSCSVLYPALLEGPALSLGSCQRPPALPALTDCSTLLPPCASAAPCSCPAVPLLPSPNAIPCDKLNQCCVGSLQLEGCGVCVSSPRAPRPFAIGHFAPAARRQMEGRAGRQGAAPARAASLPPWLPGLL